MSLVFCGLLPNNEKLVEVFCGSNQVSQSVMQTAQTKIVRAIRELEGELYCMRPDTIILTTPVVTHSTEQSIVCVNINSKLCSCAPQEKIYHGDVALAASLKEAVETCAGDLPVGVVATEELNQRVAAPLLFLLGHLPQSRLVIIQTTGAAFPQHYKIGQLMRQVILDTNERVALINSGHFGTSGDKTFAHLVNNYLRIRQLTKITQINVKVYARSKADIGGGLAFSLGVLNNMETIPTIMAAENLFDEEMAVINFVLR